MYKGPVPEKENRTLKKLKEDHCSCIAKTKKQAVAEKATKMNKG